MLFIFIPILIFNCLFFLEFHFFLLYLLEYKSQLGLLFAKSFRLIPIENSFLTTKVNLNLFKFNFFYTNFDGFCYYFNCFSIFCFFLYSWLPFFECLDFLYEFSRLILIKSFIRNSCSSSYKMSFGVFFLFLYHLFYMDSQSLCRFCIVELLKQKNPFLLRFLAELL